MYTITLHVRWRLIALFLTAALVAGSVGFFMSRAVRPRVYVAGYRVTDRTLDEVRTRLTDLETASVVFIWQGATWRFNPSELGVVLHVDEALDKALEIARTSLWQQLRLWTATRGTEHHVPLDVKIDEDVLRDVLAARMPLPDDPPVDARLRYGEPMGEVQAEVWGQGVDWELLQRRLELAVRSSEGRALPLPLRPLRPRVTAETFQGWEQLHTLGEATTIFDPGQTGRSHNIRLAAERIDGTVLLPGDEFSLNRATGERTLDTGYQEGPVIIEGELVPGVGGGVSQLASTTFNAALLAGLELTEYHNHSIPVPYLPPGRDATVWYDSLDLRFVNTTEQPVVIHAVAGYDWVRVMVRSPEPARQRVTVETRLVEEVPRPVEERFDLTLPPGERRLLESGQDGQKFVIRQVVITDGGETTERRLEATYPPKPQVWRVGPAPR